jgi:hypothetical protein
MSLFLGRLLPLAVHRRLPSMMASGAESLPLLFNKGKNNKGRLYAPPLALFFIIK